MSRSVLYEIKGKHDPSGVNQAKQDINGLGDSFSKVNNIVKAFVGAAAVKMVADLASKTMDAFKTQQSAITLLTQATANNANLAAGSLQRIISYSSQLQKSSIYGDEEIQKQATYLSSLQLTEDQIKGVLNASVQMASAGIMPLDAAVKNMAKTFGGMAGELGEKLPGLRNLTAEQLKAGAAIELVARNFNGMAEAAASTLEGTEQQVKNITGDIQEKIGSVFGELKLTALNAIKPFLEKFDTWLETASQKIINVIRNFPQVVALIGEILGTVLKNLLNIDNMFFIINEVGKYAWGVIKIFFANIGPLIVELFKEIVNNVMYVQYRIAKWFDLMGAQLSDVFMGVAEGFVNSIIKGINDAIIIANKIPGVKIASVQNVDFDTNKAAGVAATTGNYNQWKAADWSGSLKSDASINVVTQLENFFKQGAGALGDLWTNVTDKLFDGTQSQFEQLDAITQQRLEKEQEIADIGSSPAAAAASGGGGAMGLLGDMSPISLLMGALGPLIDMFMSMNSIKMILDPLQIVFKAIFDVLKPIIDSLLRPLIGIFRIVGETIGKVLAPILIQLSPIIELIAKAFVFLYNYAIKPLANAIIWVISTVYNLIANLVNGVISALNKIPFVNISWRMATMDYDSMKLQDISTSDLDRAGSEAGVGSQNSGGQSASYTGQRDITLNVFFQNSFVSGDGREVALMIRDELKAVEATGR